MSSADLSAIDEPAQVAPVDLARVGKALDLLDVRFLADGGGSLLAMWERHAVLFTLEGPDDEILVMRARPHATVPPDWADRAYRVVNEWNHTRRFCKAYVGDPTERGQLPIYAELQVPLPHRQQAPAAVGQEPDVEQIEGLADARQRDRRYLIGFVDRGQICRDTRMSRFTLRRNPDADAALQRQLATGLRLVASGRPGTP
jgi:hypothetical protein